MGIKTLSHSVSSPSYGQLLASVFIIATCMIHRRAEADQSLLTPADYATASFERLEAACDAGNADACYHLANRYLMATILPRKPGESRAARLARDEENERKGKEFMRKAAELGHVEGMVQYARHCDDDFETMKWSKKAAVQGNVEAMYILSKCCRRLGFDSEAEKWLSRAAEKGQASARRDIIAQREKPDAPRATSEFERALKNADLNLKSGLPPGSAWNKTVDDLMKYARQGNRNAQFWLGQHYYFGENGVWKDGKKAVELFRKAARQGHPYAQHMLSQCYFKGVGVPQNRVKGLAWTMIAKTHEDEQLRNQLELQMTIFKLQDKSPTAQEIREAERLAASYWEDIRDEAKD